MAKKKVNLPVKFPPLAMTEELREQIRKSARLRSPYEFTIEIHLLWSFDIIVNQFINTNINKKG